MGPDVAAAAAIGSLALDAGSKVMKGQGDEATQEFMARRDERAAELGRIKADQTDAALREELTTTLDNIKVTRAAAGTDPLSPTGIAIMDEEARVSDRARKTKIASIMAQSDEDEATAGYRRRVGRQALMGGYVGAASSVVRGFGSVGGFGGGGSGASYGKGG